MSSAAPMLSPRARRCLIVAAVLWFVACLLTLAPAAAVVRLLRWVAPQIELAAVDGSFWHGTAGQAFLNLGNQRGDARRVALGKLEWQLNGWSLLWLHPSAKISAEWGEQILDAQVRVSPFGAVNVRDLRAVVPVELVKIWAPVPVRGALGLNIAAADFNKQSLQTLQGKIDWQRAQWQWGDRWLVLGNYQFDVQTTDGVLNGKVAGGSDLAATGSFNANLDKRAYELNAQLSASRGLPQEFRDSLVFLLRAQPQNPHAGAGEPIVLQLQRSGSW